MPGPCRAGRPSWTPLYVPVRKERSLGRDGRKPFNVMGPTLKFLYCWTNTSAQKSTNFWMKEVYGFHIYRLSSRWQPLMLVQRTTAIMLKSMEISSTRCLPNYYGSSKARVGQWEFKGCIKYTEWMSIVSYLPRQLKISYKGTDLAQNKAKKFSGIINIRCQVVGC